MNGLERSLARWLDAGLIDSSTAEAIRQFEQKKSRPLVLWAIVSLACFALALGLLLIVGANWDEISPAAKLAAQFAAMLAAAIAVLDGLRRQRLWRTETALFLLSALVLAGIALQGQIYQQAAPLWQPLAFWTVLTGPALFLLGRTWLTGSLFALMLGALMLTLAMHGFEQDSPLQAVFAGTAGAIPFLMVAGTAFCRRDDGFIEALGGFGVLYVLALASLAHAAWSQTVTADDVRQAVEMLALPLLAAALAIAAAGRQPAERARLLRLIVAVSFAAGAAAILTPHSSAGSWTVLGIVLFCAMWGAIVWAAAAARDLRLYRIGVAAIALRLVIVYFELFGSLALTGFGLIAGGVLVLLLIAAWKMLMRRPTQREEPA